MSYTLDPVTGRHVLSSELSSRSARIDDNSQLPRTNSGNAQNPLNFGFVRVNSETKFAREPVSTTLGQERVYVGSRPIETNRLQETISTLKNELSNMKSEASRLVTREDSGGTRRIILMNNGRRLFDPDNSDRISVNSDLPSREHTGHTIVREPITNTFEARVLTRESIKAQKPLTGSPTGDNKALIKEYGLNSQVYNSQSQPISSQTPLASQSIYVLDLEKKVKQLQQHNKNLQEQINSMTNDGEFMMDDLNCLRHENSELKIQNGILKGLENQYNLLRKEADDMYEDNNNLKNEISLLKGELQHNSLLKSQANASLILMEQNSNLKSELGELMNLRQQYDAIQNELNNMRELQQQNGNLKTQLYQLRNIQNENSALRSELSTANTQLSLLNNQLNMYKAKSGSEENDTKSYLDNMYLQIQQLQSDLSGFDVMKRTLEAKFGYNNMPVDEFADKIYMMLNDNMRMLEALILKDEQLQEFRSRMEQNQQAIQQLGSIRRSYEENLKSINHIHETDRQKLLDLTRNFEETKIQLKQANDQIEKFELRQKQKSGEADDEGIMRLLKNKDVQITKLQVDLKNTIVKMQRIEKQLEQQRISSEARNTTEKNEIIQLSEMQLNNLNNDLQITNEKCLMLQQELARLQHENQELNQNLEAVQQQLHHMSEQLNIITNDFKTISELYNLKEKEVNEVVTMAQRTQADCCSKLQRYETDIQLLKLKQQNTYSEHREQERLLRMELEEVRNNWHNRLLNELRSFDDALREQIDELNLLKTKVTEKDDQIFHLKDAVFTSQSANTALKAEVEIEKLKSIGERKTQQVAYEVELQNLRNELNTTQKALDSLNHKMRQVLEDSRKKDEFIQRYVMGKKLSPEEKFNTQLFFRQYEIIVPHDSLKAKINEEIRQIEHLHQLNRTLAQELARAKGISEQ